jgi:hypothetical protein
VDIYLLVIQARIFLWSGIGLLAACLWLGIGPYTAAWRAALAALAAMWVARWMLQRVAGVLEERMAADMAERELAEEAKAKAEAEVVARATRTEAEARTKAAARVAQSVPPRPATAR